MNKTLAAAVKAAHDLPMTPADALSVRETPDGGRWLILTIGTHRVEVSARDNESFGRWVESRQDATGAWSPFNSSTFPLELAREVLADFVTYAAAKLAEATR